MPHLTATDPDDTSMLGVLQAHAPAVAAAREGFFRPLADSVSTAPRRPELLRLRAAELTGCTLCRNLRMREAEVDEDSIEAMRTHALAGFESDDAAALELGDAFCAGGDLDAVERVRESLGDEEAARLLLALVKAVAFGKVVVALGLEPAQPEITVVG